MRLRKIWMLVTMIWIATALPVLAQIDRASITGTVTDPSGAAVPSALVQAVAVAKGVTTQTRTNRSGVYVLAALPIGTYAVTISRKGFRSVRFESVVLRVGETRLLNSRLRVAVASTEIDVHSQAPALNETSTDLSGVVTATQLQQLPTNGRNWANLLLLAPGAIDDGGGDQRTIRFAGRARDDNNYTMDGVDATGIQEMAQKSSTRLQVSQDAVEEYDVDSMLYSADQGYGAGGHVNMVTKSGTNQFHGDAYEFFRNSSLDARSFLDPSQIPPFRFNDFGGSFGGPIQKNKTFFFANYEGARQFLGTTLAGFVPSAALRQQILQTSLQMAPIVQAYALGNVHVDPNTDELIHEGDSKISEDSWLLRLDHNFSEKTSLYVRATRDVNQTSGPLGNLLDRQEILINPANYAISVTHTFSPNVLNQAEFGVNRSPFHNPQVSVFNYAVNTDNFDPLNDDNTDNEVGTTFGLIDNLTIQHGRNTFKMGGEFRRIRLNQGITADPILTFTDNNSLINDQLNSFNERGNWCCLGYRRFLAMPYFMDEWKVKPNLTLNMGLRWEYYSVPTEAHGRTKVFDMYGCHGFCPPGSPTEFPNYHNFDPRFSFAWAPGLLHGKTVIRSGFGIFHGPGQNDDTNAAFETNNSQTILSSADVPSLAYPITPFLPLAQVTGLAPRALQRDRRDLYAEEWGGYVQQMLPQQFTFQIAYLGDAGRRLFTRIYENVCLRPPDPNTGFCPRYLPNFGEVDLKRNDGMSMFNALQVTLERHFANGLMLATNYMWSNSQNDGSVGGGEANAPENVNCRECDWGPSIYDIRHTFVTQSVYELPVGPGKKYWNNLGGFAGELLGGWQLSGIGTARTGHPLTPIIGLSAAQIPDGNDQSNQRPNLVPGVPIIPSNQNINNWINANAFAPPAPGTFGNAGTGIVRAPGWWQVDFALQKTTRLTERASLDFRVEAFNIFNHDPYGDVSSLDILSGGFGQITTTVNFNNNNDNFASSNTGTGLPRQIEFMLKLNF